MKKVLALMGSPRKNKFTDNLLDYLLNGMKDLNYDIKKLYLRDLKINHCTGCDNCGRTSNCVFNDDMQDIYDGFDNSDIIIFAAPIYFNSVNGLSKNVIDRCQRYWSIKYTLGQEYKRNFDRKGIFISVGGAPFSHNQFDGTIPVMDFFFKAINADYVGNFFLSNTDRINLENMSEIENELFKIGKDIDNIKNFYLHK